MASAIVSGLMDFIYSKERKIERILILLIIIGFILRLIPALNLSVLADDMVFAFQSAGIIDANILSTNGNPPLFFYLTDLAYKFFGYTTLAARFWPLIFGTLLIPLSYLITKKLFNKKIALASAFFVTFANLLIGLTYSEQSLVVLFFSMFGVYLGLEYLDKRKPYLIYLSAILFGLAILTKYSAPFFILSLLIFSAYYLKKRQEKLFTKKNLKLLFIFLIILILLALPFLTFNYLLYTDKGIVDVYFSRVIKTEATQQLYSGLLGQENTFFDNLFNINNYGNILLVFRANLILFFISLYGLFLLFLKKNKYKLQLAFILLFLIIPFIMQTGGSTLEKHFVFLSFILAIPAGYALTSVLDKIEKKNVRNIIIVLLTLALLINLGNMYGSPPNYFHPSAESQLKSYLNEKVEDNDLIVFDDRIYTARSFYLGLPHHVIALNQLPNFIRTAKTGNIEHFTAIYVVECATDDCGWGWVKDNPSLNETTEKVLADLKTNANLVETFNSRTVSGNEFYSSIIEEPRYNVYKTYDLLNPELVSRLDLANAFFFTPYLYKNLKGSFFDYEIRTDLGNMLNKIAYVVLWLAILLTLASIILLFFFLIRSSASQT